MEALQAERILREITAGIGGTVHPAHKMRTFNTIKNDESCEFQYYGAQHLLSSKTSEGGINLTLDVDDDGGGRIDASIYGPDGSHIKFSAPFLPNGLDVANVIALVNRATARAFAGYRQFA